MTSLNQEQLAQAVARIAELDGERTPGEWHATGHGVFMGGGYGIQQFGHAHDMFFAASAPTMAAIIKQLWAEREQQRAVMEQARAVLELQRDKLYTLRRGLPSPWRNSCQDDRIGDMVASMSNALTALTAVLDGGDNGK